MSRPIIIITGANGFIGKAMVRHFDAKGWRVRALVHSLPDEKLGEVTYIRYGLEDAPDQRNFNGARYLIHCAHVGFGENGKADQINFDGARAMIAMSREHGIKFVFLSSFSAHGEAESHYGRVKLRIESLADPALDLVLRPGLVLGREGLFASLSRMIAKQRLVPIVGGGWQPVQTLALDDLCLIVDRGLESNISGIYNIAESKAVTLRELYEGIAGRRQRRVLFVPIPACLAYGVCRAAEIIGLRLPVSSDSVLGLKHLRSIETGNDLAVFGIPIKSWRETLASLPD